MPDQQASDQQEFRVQVRHGPLNRPVYQKRRALMKFDRIHKNIIFEYINGCTVVKAKTITQIPTTPPRGSALRFVAKTAQEDETIIQFESHVDLMKAYLLLKSNYLEKSQFIHSNARYNGRGLFSTASNPQMDDSDISKSESAPPRSRVQEEIFERLTPSPPSNKRYKWSDSREKRPESLRSAESTSSERRIKREPLHELAQKLTKKATPSQPMDMLCREELKENDSYREYDVGRRTPVDGVESSAAVVVDVQRKLSDLAYFGGLAGNKSKNDGFANLGNTCYMNAMLQGLFAMEIFSKDLFKFCKMAQKLDVDLDEEMPMSLALSNLANKRTSAFGYERTLLLQAVKDASCFRGNAQQDANEFLVNVLNQVHDECDKILKEKLGVNDVKKRNTENPVMMNYAFAVESTIKCDGCASVSQTEEDSIILPVTINENDERRSLPSVQTLLDAYLEAEKVERKCEKCKGTIGQRVQKFTRLPRCLIVFIKRYAFDSQQSVKRADRIGIPMFLTLYGHCSNNVAPFLAVPQSTSIIDFATASPLKRKLTNTLKNDASPAKRRLKTEFSHEKSNSPPFEDHIPNDPPIILRPEQINGVAVESHSQAFQVYTDEENVYSPKEGASDRENDVVTESNFTTSKNDQNNGVASVHVTDANVTYNEGTGIISTESMKMGHFSEMAQMDLLKNCSVDDVLRMSEEEQLQLAYRRSLMVTESRNDSIEAKKIANDESEIKDEDDESEVPRGKDFFKKEIADDHSSNFYRATQLEAIPEDVELGQEAGNETDIKQLEQPQRQQGENVLSANGAIAAEELLEREFDMPCFVPATDAAETIPKKQNESEKKLEVKHGVTNSSKSFSSESIEAEFESVEENIEWSQLTEEGCEVLNHLGPQPIPYKPISVERRQEACLRLNIQYHCDPIIKSGIHSITIKDAPLICGCVIGDGNCLFRSLAYYISGCDSEHLKIREKIIAFEMEHWNCFVQMKNWTYWEWSKHMDRLLNYSGWGSEIELFAFASLLNVNVFTYYNRRWLCYRPRFKVQEGEMKLLSIKDYHIEDYEGIYLANADHHFSPVFSVSDSFYQLEEAEKQSKEAKVSDYLYVAELELSGFTQPSYRLVSLISHIGSESDSGHYVCDIWCKERKGWLYCNDEKVEPISDECLELRSDIGYIYFYLNKEIFESENS